MFRYSLVVVHGLPGGCISTWTHPEGPCWLDWLSSEIPELRIFVYGYGAQDVYLESENKPAGSSRVFTFAEALCTALKDVRVNVSQLESKILCICD